MVNHRDNVGSHSAGGMARKTGCWLPCLKGNISHGDMRVSPVGIDGGDPIYVITRS